MIKLLAVSDMGVYGKAFKFLELHVASIVLEEFCMSPVEIQ